MNTVKSIQGFSLIEVLVALVVMSIGMLGIAALYIESVKSSRAAVLRTQAISFTFDMADRIRANRLAGARYRLAFGAAPPAARGCVDGNNCTNLDLADDDINRWVNAVRAPGTGMPWNGATPPETQITFAAGAAATEPDTYNITIRWREPNQDPADPPYQYNLAMQVIPSTPL
jgi:type IV pilus assembly protein PilV